MSSAGQAAPPTSWTIGLARRLAGLALDGVGREYPNKATGVVWSDADVSPPRVSTPVFYGCFDWHSSVHSHWLLACVAGRFAETPLAEACRGCLTTRLTAEGLEEERAYVARRPGFERPYGLAWLLRLSAELRGLPWAEAQVEALSGLEALAAERLSEWFRRLPYPIRSGEHSQSALAMSLMYDWAVAVGDGEERGVVIERAVALYGADRDGALHLEPSGHDFLSPCLSAADLMRRVLSRSSFERWFDRFLPGLDPTELAPVRCPDPSDGKLAHLDGLNLSRAWMLYGIAGALDERRSVAMVAAAERHLAQSLPAARGEHYEGAHWLGTFAAFALEAAEVVSGVGDRVTAPDAVAR